MLLMIDTSSALIYLEKILGLMAKAMYADARTWRGEIAGWDPLVKAKLLDFLASFFYSSISCHRWLWYEKTDMWEDSSPIHDPFTFPLKAGIEVSY